MQYFTSDKRVGRVRYGALHWRIGVDAAPDSPQRIGDASEVGVTPTGLALWQLRVQGDEVPGLWVIVDGQFVAVEDVRE
jgi:hypothetical protein